MLQLEAMQRNRQNCNQLIGLQDKIHKLLSVKKSLNENRTEESKNQKFNIQYLKSKRKELELSVKELVYTPVQCQGLQ